MTDLIFILLVAVAVAPAPRSVLLLLVLTLVVDGVERLGARIALVVVEDCVGV